MASKSTLNAKNLETLGAERLAELLIEISTGSAVAKRRLRLELAGTQSPKEAGREVAKRLTSIARARSFVNWQNRKPLVTDLESQLRAIREQIAPADPAEALALAWRFMQVATPLFERCDDSSGIVIGVFHDACALLGEIALAAETPPEALADAAVEALRDNGYGQYDGLIAILTPALGAEGLSHLKQRIEMLAAAPVPVPPKGESEAVGYGSGGATYAHQMEELSRQSMVRMALKDTVDAMDDVDAFIAQYSPATARCQRSLPRSRRVSWPLVGQKMRSASSSGPRWTRAARQLKRHGDVKRHEVFEIGVNRNHPPHTQLVTLAHELARIYLGHCGEDPKRGVKFNRPSDLALREVEAETVAYLVAKRTGVSPRSEKYLEDYQGAFDRLDHHRILKAAGTGER